MSDPIRDLLCEIVSKAYKGSETTEAEIILMLVDACAQMNAKINDLERNKQDVKLYSGRGGGMPPL